MFKATLAAAATAMILGGTALAQPAPNSSVTQHGRASRPPPSVQTPGQQTPGQDHGQKPLFHVLGTPAYVTAPVASPYANSAYQNNGGQPQHSSETLLKGAPAPGP